MKNTESQLFKYHQKRIEAMFPEKNLLNLGQSLKIIGKNRVQFKKLVDQNRLNELPKFKCTSIKRKDKAYHLYQFKVYDLIKFLEEESLAI